MRFFTALLMAACAITVYAAPTITEIDSVTNPEDDPVDNYKVIPYPGADEIILNGTISEVYARVLEINPNYEADWANYSSTATGSEDGSEEEGGSDLTTRDDKKKPKDLHCFKVWADGKTSPTQEGIYYLRKFKLPPGLKGNSCKTVSCAYTTAIRWCNDRPTLRVLPSFNNIADGAQVIYNYCQRNYDSVGGWLGHSDDWRVFVDKGDC
ncbi:hypothetical protein BDV18DRAFT_161561 [Aspergillus unguis]